MKKVLPEGTPLKAFIEYLEESNIIYFLRGAHLELILGNKAYQIKIENTQL